MKLVRTGKITGEEAKVLLDAVKEKGELVFPLSKDEVEAVLLVLQKAKSTDSPYQPSIREKILSKWNYNYASVASFALWVGAKNVNAENVISKSGGSALKLSLCSINSVNWAALKSDVFNAPLI